MEAQATGEGAVIDDFDFIEKVTLTDDEKIIESIQTNYTTSLVEGDIAKVVRGLDEEGNTIIQGVSPDGAITYWTSKIVFK